MLLPIGNIPLLEFAINLVETNNFDEIHIVGNTKHASKLNEFKKKYHPKIKTIPDNIIINLYSDVNSLGDCFRELSKNNVLMESDFLLIRGPVVSNFDLDGMFKKHQERRRQDPTIIMTTLFKEARGSVLADYDKCVLVIDKKTDELLLIENSDNPDITVNPLVLEHIEKKAGLIEYRNDLVDCFIDVCSAKEVFGYFTDNFDFHTMRDGFVKNILANEIYLERFFAYKLPNSAFCGVIKNFQSYLQVNAQVIARWAYPTVLDTYNNKNLGVNFKYNKKNIYLDGTVHIGRTSFLKNTVCVGSNSEIGEDSSLEKASLGQGVIIGKNCIVENSILLPGCTIEDNVAIKNCILAESVHVEAKSELEDCYVQRGIELESDEYLDQRLYLEDGVVEKVVNDEFEDGIDEKERVLKASQPYTSNENEDEEEGECSFSSEIEEEKEESEFLNRFRRGSEGNDRRCNKEKQAARQFDR